MFRARFAAISTRRGKRCAGPVAPWVWHCFHRASSFDSMIVVVWLHPGPCPFWLLMLNEMNALLFVLSLLVFAFHLYFPTSLHLVFFALRSSLPRERNHASWHLKVSSQDSREHKQRPVHCAGQPHWKISASPQFCSVEVRFWRRGCTDGKSNFSYTQFCVIDPTEGKSNSRFAKVLGDQRHDFRERVGREKS